MKLTAVLFDMDGLITDSEAYGHEVLKSAGRQLGFELSDQLLYDMIGVNDVKCIETLNENYPGLDGAQVLQMYRRAMYDASVKGLVPLKPGVCELLDALDAHRIRRAVASSNDRFLVEGYLGRCGILQRFDALVCGDMIRRSKPAPDIYLKAARRLQVPPSACAGVEDSPSGLRSVRAAGMYAIMVPDQIPYTPALAPYADAVLDSLHGLSRLLAL